MNAEDVLTSSGPATMRPYASRIAVLPFENLSGTSDDERLARGFWQDIITELARFPSLGVVAAQSSVASGQSGLPGADSRLGQRSDYVVQGSIRRSGDVIRVGAQLIETRTGQQLWAERYDRPEVDVFAIQDEITARVANALNARIDQQNLSTARRRPVTTLAAYEAWLRGFECLQRGTIESDEEARTYFERALEFDPQFARGYAGLSMSYFNEWSCQAWERWEETEKKSFEYARRAEALDPNDQVAQIMLGKIQQYRRKFDAARHHFDRALALSPNDAEVLVHLATCYAQQGQAELGAALGTRGLELNPLCPAWYYPYAALPYFFLRQYREGIEMVRKAPVNLMVDLPAYMAAAHAYLGDADEAGAMLAEFEREFRERIVFGREPGEGETELWLRHVNPLRREQDVELLIEGVRLAHSMQFRNRGGPVGATAVAAVNSNQPPRTFAWPIANTFRKEGDTWIMCYDHHVAQMPELKGFRDIAYLLGRPDEEIHCLTLAGRDEEGATPGAGLLDERARRDYQARIRELQAEVDEAADANDPGRAARAQEELEVLLSEIGRATGLGGRTRKMGDPAERARSAITWRIRNAIKKLTKRHPALGRHLENSLQTGIFCRYSPEKPTDWSV